MAQSVRPEAVGRPLSRSQKAFAKAVNREVLDAMHRIARQSESYEEFRYNLIEVTRNNDDDSA